MAVNNEVGTLQDWALIAGMCQSFGVRFHEDAVQAPGKVPFSVADLGAGTTASVSAHKMGGPKGMGALWIARQTRQQPLVVGGEQERGRRAGTENVPGIVGFGAACRFIRERGDLDGEVRRRAEACFLVGELRRLEPEVVVHGPEQGSPQRPGPPAARLPQLPLAGTYARRAFCDSPHSATSAMGERCLERPRPPGCPHALSTAIRKE